MSEHKPSIEVEGIVRRAPDRIVLRYRSGEGYQNISAAMKVPNNTVESIIFKQNIFLLPPRLFLELAKLSNQGRRALVRQVTKNPMVTDRAVEFLCGDGRTFQKDIHPCSTPPIRPLW
jgi:hypothetical protein